MEHAEEEDEVALLLALILYLTFLSSYVGVMGFVCGICCPPARTSLEGRSASEILPTSSNKIRDGYTRKI
jgi:hypothetical protein